jgi:hypothetical protein
MDGCSAFNTQMAWGLARNTSRPDKLQIRDCGGRNRPSALSRPMPKVTEILCRSMLDRKRHGLM